MKKEKTYKKKNSMLTVIKKTLSYETNEQKPAHSEWNPTI